MLIGTQVFVPTFSVLIVAIAPSFSVIQLPALWNSGNRSFGNSVVTGLVLLLIRTES